MRNSMALLAGLTLVSCAGGGGGGTTGGTSPSAVVFPLSPIAAADVSRIVPLGNLNPPGHTIPSDHIYLYTWYYDDGPVPDPNRKYAVVAPAAGTVEFILQPGSDYKIAIRCTSTFSYYLDHILVDPGIQIGDSLAAGQAIGTSSGPYAIDWGVVDLNVTLTGFTTPARYHEGTLHSVSPLPYCEAALRGVLEAKVLRVGADKNGRIDFDQPGKLIGNWFLEGVTVEDSDMPASWDKQLAIVPDVKDPSILRVSIGGQLAMVGAYAANPADPDPTTITAASGKKIYRLYNRGGLLESPYYNNQLGLLVVQMLDDARVRVEAFADAVSSDRDFTAAAKIYVR